jgi:class 3 adenylate cyclase/tetratricopeptide (TPR) repeat protein
MNCPKCQSENRDEIKFCEQCGAKMELECPNCKAKIPLGKKFCGECGHTLGIPAKPTPKELSFDEKIQKIQKYLPGGLTEKILAQRGKIEGERKQVTVLFADMENFTPLVEKLGPEEAYAIMDQVYEILIHKVHDFEGTINEMTGDGVMALFGAPIALEDAPQRAIRSALAIHQEIARFSDRMKQEKGIPQIKMRIGIHTGPVVVGTLGNDLRVEFKAVGDTVNLASRIQNLAASGTTYVSDDAFKLTEGLFRFESLGAKEIKGKDQPVHIYQVIAPSSRRTRFDVNAERGLTPFVGRTRELENLLDGLDRAKAGRGQAFSLIGEAGVGKSRLLYEFHKAVTNEDITFLEGKSLSYGRGSAYHPIVDILKATFNVNETDTDQKIREKVTNGLEMFKIDVASSLPYLLELLSVKDSGMEKIPLSPEGKKDKIIEILKQISLRGSEIRPLIMAIEDIHWVDKSTEDALKYILEIIPGAGILLIFTYRPEYVHTWGRKSYHNQLTLNRLSNRESLAMACNLLGDDQIDKEIEEMILSRTEGIPFFIEEFIKSLKDLKIIERQNGAYKLTKDLKTITIPSTIQDVIMARVDALSEGAKEIIRTGSVIEREFNHELLKKVTDLPERELLSNLSILKDSELIYERGIYPDSTYIFKHALTREVVYDSLLAKKKKTLHEHIGKAIEDIHKEDLCYYYGVLASHCLACENYEKGAEYARLEAKRLQKAASYRDAIGYTKKRIACLEKLSQSEDVLKRIIDARVMLSTSCLNINYQLEAKNAVEPIINLALDLSYQKRLPGIYAAMGQYYIWVEEDISKGKQYLKEVFEIATKVRDFYTLWVANFMLGNFANINYQFDESVACFKACIDMSVLSNNLNGISSAKSGLAVSYNYQGKTDLALQTSTEAILTAKDLGDIIVMQFACTSQGLSCYYKGYFSEAEKYLLEGLALYEKTTAAGWGALAAGFLGFTYGHWEEYGKADEYHQKCISILESERFMPSWHNTQKLFIAKAKILNHESDIDLYNLNTLIESHEKSKVAACESFGTRCIAEIYLNIDNQHMVEAEKWIKRAIDFNTKHDTKWELARDHALYADWFKKKGNISKAREQLSIAIGIFKKCGADGWVAMKEKSLSEML